MSSLESWSNNSSSLIMFLLINLITGLYLGMYGIYVWYVHNLCNFMEFIYVCVYVYVLFV